MPRLLDQLCRASMGECFSTSDAVKTLCRFLCKISNANHERRQDISGMGEIWFLDSTTRLGLPNFLLDTPCSSCLSVSVSLFCPPYHQAVVALEIVNRTTHQCGLKASRATGLFYVAHLVS